MASTAECLLPTRSTAECLLTPSSPQVAMANTAECLLTPSSPPVAMASTISPQRKAKSSLGHQLVALAILSNIYINANIQQLYQIF